MHDLVFFCPNCEHNFFVTPEDLDTAERILEKLVFCPYCFADRIRPTLRPKQNYRDLKLTSSEMWQAINGLGLPGERLNPEEIRKLMTDSIVVGLDIDDEVTLRTGNLAVRSILIKKSDGGIVNKYRVHLGIGSGTAVAYKVTKVGE